MITLLNFAPIDYGGGAEKWMLNVGEFLEHNDKTQILCIDQSISNFYSRIVLKRNFTSRISIGSIVHKIGLTEFLPWTESGKSLRQRLISSDTIYIRFEVLEVLILIYFGGFSILRKSIAGLHTPLVYKYPVSMLQKLHKYLYESQLILFVLSKFRKIHVLSLNDYKFLTKYIEPSKLAQIPNWVAKTETIDIKCTNRSENLNILFVGELSEVKGADILARIIESTVTKPYTFHIIGDGAYRHVIRSLEQKFSNTVYHGYLNSKQIFLLMGQSDLLIIPSRAEGMPFVALEALQCGLPLLISDSCALDLPENIQSVALGNSIADYIDHIEYFAAHRSDYIKSEITKFACDHFDKTTIFNRIKTELFQH